MAAEKERAGSVSPLTSEVFKTSEVRGPDTVLIVDDEEPVRQTFREWLEGAGLGVRILAAAGAESALLLANEQPIDLAILDWNLGAGNDGLQLLEDLYVFNPDVVAVMITGYAHQATPLDAMRMGVRDYLDKNQDLNRDTFLGTVRKQLERIRPAKRERRVHAGLAGFREAVGKVLPLVQSAAALNDPLSLPEAVASLFRFLLRSTQARDGVLLVRSYDPERSPAEVCRAYDTRGEQLPAPAVPFSRSLAGAAVSMGEARVINHAPEAPPHSAELQPFERGKQSLLVAPLPGDSGFQAVLELFDKQRADGTPNPEGFSDRDRELAAAAAEFGGEVLRHALAERQTHRVLFDAIEMALRASESLSESLRAGRDVQSEPTAPAVLEKLKESLAGPGPHTLPAEETLRLAEAVRVLALRHGPGAVRHCARLVEEVRALLDAVTGAGEGGQ